MTNICYKLCLKSLILCRCSYCPVKTCSKVIQAFSKLSAASCKILNIYLSFEVTLFDIFTNINKDLYLISILNKFIDTKNIQHDNKYYTSKYDYTVYSHKSAEYTFIGAYYKESQQQYICQKEYKELNKHHKSCIKAFCNPAVGLVHQSINLHQKE